MQPHPAPETALPPAAPFIVEPVYTAQELAAAWKLSDDTIRALFLDEPGVIVIQAPKKRGTRVYRTVRVPESVARRVWTRLQQRHSRN
jgi:hypothetical protein